MRKRNTNLYEECFLFYKNAITLCKIIMENDLQTTQEGNTKPEPTDFNLDTEGVKETEKKNWLHEMVEREAIPKPERSETKEEFCKRHTISVSTYEYHQRKDETKKKVVKIWLSEAFIGGNTVLRKLKEKADGGDIKAIELYMKFVLQLAEQLDVKHTGEIRLVFDKVFEEYDSNSTQFPERSC